MAEIEVLKRRRAYVKGTITFQLKRLDTLEQIDGAGPSISGLLARSLVSEVQEKLKLIEEFTESICLLLKDEEMQEEISKNCTYVFEIRTRISKYLESISIGVSPQAGNANEASVKLPLPKITLNPFENNLKNPFAYYTFKKTFLNALAGIPNLTNAQRLIYLKNFVKGEALN